MHSILEKITVGAPPLSIGGLNGSAKAWVLSQWIQHGPSKTWVYMAAGGREAAAFKQDLEFFLGPFAACEVHFFPPHDVLPFTKLSPHNDIACERMATLYHVTRRPAPAFIGTTVAAALSRLPPRRILEAPLLLKTGQETNRDQFLKILTDLGYQSVPLVIDRGNFAVRGALVDLFSPLSSHPLRIEWLGDLVESIREFDSKTQRTLAAREEAVVIPAREILLDEESIRTFSEKARKAAEDRDLTRSAWAPLAEKIKARIPFPGIETYLPLFYERPTTLREWLPVSAVLVTENFEGLRPVIEEHLEEIRTVMGNQQTLLSLDEVRMSVEEFYKTFAELPRIEFNTLEPSQIRFACETHGEIRREIELGRKGVDPLAPLAKRLSDWLLTDRVFLIASSQAQAIRLSDLLSHHLPNQIEISTKGFSEAVETPGKIQILIGQLSSGFRLPDQKLTILTEEEIFGKKIRKASHDVADGARLSSFAELKMGEPIVHKEHGIGLYQGLVHMMIDRTENDFLVIEYKGGDKLYLPVYRMNVVQRYTGSDGATPRLDQMGGASWAKVKGKAEKAIQELAGELLNLYAARSSGQGFAFSPPNELFETFEASFPYEETPDQERAIAEVLQDMQKDRPMDRLVLGDVGYGKTEVALRAAFKAALDGKQTAFLVPTTLLAFQHYERFLERFKNYPVRVKMISRFRSPAEQKLTLQEAAAGKIDILIGTHRLLQPDISFKDLGLLVIDEEHHFGVGHKEKIKRLKKNVDVLALSATPIPRTLYMSLVGIRGISVIETPPTDRLAIRTFVMPFQDTVIAEAITREFKRGGQVFFVHNEIETMGKMKAYLQSLAPEAKIEIAHGQMEEDTMEATMIRFFHQEFNLLLCTTIIESGIDIPTANTILINEVDHFGLSQIYQLRGRVGRGSHRAYAYLLIEEDKTLTAEATQRLSVLQRFSELGSGFKMASYDLEIRGAGNLLGTEQSGQMRAIGYELYTELLEKAVRELKGETVLDEIEPELHFPISSFLPESYVPDPPLRLELYRQLASLTSEEEIDPVEAELRDRFGAPPPEVENLLELSTIKTHAKKLRIKQIRYDKKYFVYAFDPSSPLPPELLMEKIKKDPKHYRLTPDFRLIVQKPLPRDDMALAETKRFLRELVLHLG